MGPRPQHWATPVLNERNDHRESWRSSLKKDEEGDRMEEKKFREEDTLRSKQERRRFLAYLRQNRPFGFRQVTISRIFFTINHVLAWWGLYYIFMGAFSWKILLFEFIYNYLGSMGTTIGAHRYWTHKAFKAKTPLRILLMCMQTITAHYSLYKWCLDHRIHHKYTDTNKDPHNSKRGFWFSHILWVLQDRHPDHLQQLETFDMPDLENDPVILFQAKWYTWLAFFFYGFLPIRLIRYFGGVPLFQAFSLNCLRWVYNTHISAAVNSFAHIWGDKPYDKNITSTDNKIVSLFAVGEGWHNYHHTFPWDYKASELGWKINVSTMFIDFFAWIGWAYDLKTVNGKMLQEKIEKSGDGSHAYFSRVEPEETLVDQRVEECCDSTATWGWDDDAVSQKYREMTTILKPLDHHLIARHR